MKLLCQDRHLDFIRFTFRQSHLFQSGKEEGSGGITRPRVVFIAKILKTNGGVRRGASRTSQLILTQQPEGKVTFEWKDGQ